MIASIVGFLTFSFSLPPDQRFMPLFGDGLDYHFGSAWELLPLALLAGALTVVSIAYINCFYGVVRLFKKLPGPPHVRPALGAFLTGVAGLALFASMGRDTPALAVFSSGYGALQTALSEPNDLGVGLLLALGLVKILTTSLTIGSGGSGGVFGPSIVIGGCLSGAFAGFLHERWPHFVRQPEIYPIVGMAGFFACCAHAPISTILMVAEITGDYQLLLPATWVSTICFLLNRRWTLYIKQVPTRRHSLAHRAELPIEG